MAKSRPLARRRSAQHAVTKAPQNLLIAALPGKQRRDLLARCEAVELTFGDLLYSQDQRIRHVYFPTGGFISLISSVDGRARLEVGLVGAEGMLGISLAAGENVAPLHALVQGAGQALRIEASQFARVLERSPALRELLTRYAYVLMNQLAQLAACTCFHRVEARLARWLLMTRDRARSDEFYLTQEFLAYMLGVRRVGVTRAARSLKQRKLIDYNRGAVVIRNGRGLERVTCSCYAAGKQMHETVMSRNSPG
jgi:CRP-like cAMP-binding protein